MSRLCLVMLVSSFLAAVDHRIECVDALGKGKSLFCYLHVGDGGILAFAEAPRFNRLPYPVDATGLVADVAELRGTIAVTIPSDGYVPETDGAARLTVRVTPDGGTWKGTVLGREARGAVALHAYPEPPEGPVLLRLDGENACFHHTKQPGRGRRLGLVLGFDGDEVAGGYAIPPGSPTDVGFCARLAHPRLEVEGRRIRGHLECAILPQGDGPPSTLVHEVDWLRIGDRVAGTAAIHASDEVARWKGTITPAIPPEDADHVWILQDAIPGNFLVIRARVRDGGIVRGFATAPNHNNAIHDCDFADARIADGRLAGTVAVTINPDPWVPADGEPVAGRFAVDTALANGLATGTFAGEFGGAAVEGAVEGGRRTIAPPPDPARITFKLENALAGGDDWHNRAFLTCEVDEDGAIAGGRVWNNHTELGGTVDAGTVTATADELRAEVAVTVLDGGGVDAGAYRFAIDGILVDGLCAGSFVTRRDGGRIKDGTFWASWKDR